MKVNGVEVKGPAEEVLVLPRPTSKDLVFIAKAVLNTDEFSKMVPEPKAKARLEAGGWKKNLDDPAFKKALMEYGELRFAWMVIKSLEPSNIEWDKVNIDKPSTWMSWSDEMKEGGMSQTEINRVINCVASANALNEQKLEAARESFLQGLAKASENSTGQNSDQENTQSGEDVSG
jgi:hypothetical protein